jgi:hypothetical protein
MVIKCVIQSTVTDLQMLVNPSNEMKEIFRRIYNKESLAGIGTSGSSSIFGGGSTSSSGSLFGGNTSANLFGVRPATAAPSGSIFGGSTGGGSNLFGGSGSAPQQSSSIFGGSGSASLFGAPAQSQSVFGSPAQQSGDNLNKKVFFAETLKLKKFVFWYVRKLFFYDWDPGG